MDCCKNVREGAWHNGVYTYVYANDRTETFYVDGIKVGTPRTNTWTPGATPADARAWWNPTV